ncbi:glycosyltransferase family 39 protein [Clostridia bacterium OttesenSCG-928-O13]|nr:glycosyltransferase family 39 protein [Clostridia bacterium OttesenSCG-928-O13]
MFTLAFGWVFLWSVFGNKSFGYHPLVSVFLAVGFAALLLFLWRLLARFAPFWRRWGRLVCLGAMAVLGAAQLAIGLALRFTPSYDMDAIFGGGIYWAENGTLATSDYYMAYFHMFPNNMGGLFLLRCVFGAARFLGATDYFAVAVALNVLLMQAAVYLSWDLTRRAFGPMVAAFCLLLFVVFVPFYMMGAVFYTDLLSVVFPILMLDLFLIGKKQKTSAKKWAVFLLLGLVCGVGTLVKLPSVIAFLAIVVAALAGIRRPPLKEYLAKTLLPLAASALVMALVLGLFQLFVTGRTLDDERLEKESMPLSHWVAMGLMGEGGYDEADYDRAMKLPSKTAREEVNRQLIITRLTQPSLAELGALFTRKAVRCFGDGTYGLSIFLDDGPHHWSTLHDFVLFEGKHYSLYSHFCQGLYLGVFSLVLAGAAKASLRMGKTWRFYRFPAPWIALFGLLLFLLLWETNSRYTLNYMPVLFVCAAAGASVLLPAKARSSSLTKRLAASSVEVPATEAPIPRA